MEFRMLGPLSVLHDGAPVALKGRHQPRLLAMLLLDAGRTVTMSRLVETLWDDEPPDTARRQVQNYMAALRRSLGTTAITSAGDGYRLELNGSTVDAVRFAELVDRARTDSRRGMHAEALTSLDAALDLWRGAPLAGLSGRSIAAGAARWEEKRLAAVEERAETRLELGRHAEVVAELTETLTRQPFRQRPAQLLMRALYRCGRTAEAVTVYEELRRRLAEELGIDPDPGLRELSERIRRGEAETLGPPEPATGPASETPVPAQLPAGVSTFTGRSEQLDRLDALLDTAGRIAVVSAVSGGGGVGKTALAVHWGRNHSDRFPDGQLYVNLRGFDQGEPVAPLDALGQLLRSLGAGGAKLPDDVDELAARYRSRLAGRRLLLVLDNARTVEQVRPLLPGPGGCLTIVTSRNRLAGLAALDNAALIGLDALAPGESQQLLRQLLGAERLTADPLAARRLAELCGHLPLALRIAAANLAARPNLPVSDFVTALDDATRLEQLAPDDDPRAAVGATFELSVKALTPASRELFGSLGVIPGADFPRSLAVDAAGTTEAEADRALRELVAAHLLEEHTEGRYRFHDLVRLFAIRRSKDTMDEAARGRVVDAVLDWYYERRVTIAPADVPNALDTCAAWSQHPGMWRAANSLLVANECGIGHDRVRDVCAIALESARRHGDRRGEAQMLSVLGGAHYLVGDIKNSLVFSRRAVAAAADVDAQLYGAMCNNLGMRLYWVGQCLEAERWLRTSLRAKNGPLPARSEHARLLNLASVCRVLGRFPEAEDLLNRCETTIRDETAGINHISIHIARSILYCDMGRATEAWNAADRALTASRDKGVHRQIALALQHRGRAAARSGRLAEARADLLESEAVSRRHALALIGQAGRVFLAELEAGQGDYHRAREHLDAAGAADDAQPAPVQVAVTQQISCLIHTGLNDYPSAAEAGRLALAAFAAMPEPLRQARTLVLLADALDGLGHHTQADEHRDEALTIFTRLDVPEARSLSSRMDARPR